MKVFIAARTINETHWMSGETSSRVVITGVFADRKSADDHAEHNRFSYDETFEITEHTVKEPKEVS